MSQQNKTQLQSTINTNVADNTVGDISAADIRNPLIDLTDSLLFNSGSQTFDGTLTATAFVGDGSAITGVTGEWDGTLNGNAEITGSLIISDSLNVTNFITASKISLNDGGDSVFIGQNAGTNDDGTGNRSVGIGVQALEANTTGTSNTAIGYQSLEANTTGGQNASVGTFSLWSNVGGINNTATGYQSLLSNTSGDNNVASGYRSLRVSTTANNNVAIGYEALTATTTGSNNVALGTQAGEINTTGANNVFLGTESRPLSVNQSNQIVIGYQAVGKGSNTVTIGNDSITNNYFEGDVSATSFTGNGATISGSLIASGSVVDFTDATAISGSTFSGSFVGDGSGLTLPATSGTAKMFSGVFAENSGVSLALTTERNDFDSTSPLIANRLGVGYYVFIFSGGAFNLNSSSTVYSFQPDPNSGTVSVGFYSADVQGSNQLYIIARDTTGAMADGVLDDVEFRITQFSS
ncbi:hypothetical protein N9P60_00810 [bacterium]|nr:hypothetical protein [bacterium]MDB4319784.1 hypothetical protein [bacterium]